MVKRTIIFLFIISFVLTSFFPAHASAASLRSKIRDLDRRRVDNVPMPILFGLTPDNMTRNFGDPRSGGRRHEGQDILAPIGAPLVTPTEAVVIRVGKGDSSGYYVYTANPGRETFVYMHLNKMSDLDEGDVLKKGDLIGYIGNTGNASGGVAHVHFELHDDDGNPIDPYDRIKRIFPIADKIKYLEAILDSHEEPEELAEFIVRAYRSELILANTLGLPVPALIQSALISIPMSAPAPTVYTNTSNNPNRTLRIGASGSAVLTLQKFLVSKNAGFNNGVVADGIFDERTMMALIDYQRDVGLVADGIYGPITRAHILAHP